VLFGVEQAPFQSSPTELQRLLPHMFSFSQLQAYETCPWQYRFAFLLGVPVPGKPSASFGRSMHSALYEFFRRGRERTENPQGDLFGAEQASGQTAVFPSKEELLQLYDDYWIDEWYESERQKEEYYKKGKEALAAFYDLHVNNWPQIQELEQRFTMQVDDFKIKGAIDRVDVLKSDKDGVTTKVMDYKTGKVDMKKDPKQLYIYAMALQEVFQVDVKELSYYFIEENVEYSMALDPKKLEKTREWVLEMIMQIRSGDFAPTPGFQCKHCDFKDICEYRAA
jgi:CRISPR/Cas system-associated exonuclease Cas4 (RecB family)